MTNYKEKYQWGLGFERELIIMDSETMEIPHNNETIINDFVESLPKDKCYTLEKDNINTDKYNVKCI